MLGLRGRVRGVGGLGLRSGLRPGWGAGGAPGWAPGARGGLRSWWVGACSGLGGQSPGSAGCWALRGGRAPGRPLGGSEPGGVRRGGHRLSPPLWARGSASSRGLDVPAPPPCQRAPGGDRRGFGGGAVSDVAVGGGRLIARVRRRRSIPRCRLGCGIGRTRGRSGRGIDPDGRGRSTIRWGVGGRIGPGALGGRLAEDV